MCRYISSFTPILTFRNICSFSFVKKIEKKTRKNKDLMQSSELWNIKWPQTYLREPIGHVSLGYFTFLVSLVVSALIFLINNFLSFSFICLRAYLSLLPTFFRTFNGSSSIYEIFRQSMFMYHFYNLLMIRV